MDYKDMKTKEQRMYRECANEGVLSYVMITLSLVGLIVLLNLFVLIF